MKKFLSALLAAVMMFALLAAIPTAAAATYVTDGLVAMYDGSKNTASGQDKAATTWADLSGNGNNITDVPKTDACYFSDTAYVLDSVKVDFPAAIDSVVAGDAFTVELRLGALTSKGTGFNTFINCPSDDFSLFRRVDGDFIEFKNTSNARPKVAGGLEYFKNSTVSITFTAGGKCTLYVDGVSIGEVDAAAKLPNTADMFFGHDEASRNYTAEFEAMRFYSRALSASEIAANYAADTANDSGTDKPADDNPTTSDAAVVVIAAVAAIALAGAVVIKKVRA